MPTQAERRASTVGAITRAARNLFSKRGFTEASVDEIVARSGVTKGAFYHHFRSKEELFRGVLEERQQALSAEVLAAAATGGDALERVKRGCHAFLRTCCRPAFRRIVLIDGPKVIGWEAWREIDARYFGAMTRHGLEDAMREGSLQSRRVEPLAQLIVGAVTEAAMVCARSAKPEDTARELMAGLEALLDGLR